MFLHYHRDKPQIFVIDTYCILNCSAVCLSYTTFRQHYVSDIITIVQHCIEYNALEKKKKKKKV